MRFIHCIGDSCPIAIDRRWIAIIRSGDIGGDRLRSFLAQSIEFLRLTIEVEDPIVIGGMDLLQAIGAAGGVRRRLFMKIPFYISTAARVDLSCRLFYPFVINVFADKLFLSYILIMSLGFDHRAIGFAAIVKDDTSSRRWIGEAESEPHGQRRRALRIDDASDILLY